MQIINNFSITRLFITKTIDISIDGVTINMRIPTIKEFYTNNDFNSVFHLWTMPIADLQKLFFTPINTSYEALTTMIFEYGQYARYRLIANGMRDALKFIFTDINIDMVEKKLKIGDITIDEEIWENILYLLKLSCGEKVNQPLTFASEEARKFFMAQREKEERIAKLKSTKQVDQDALIKSFLSITYAFPSLTIDYLCNQTMAQIQWLQKYAAGAMSYEVNAQALAAGNMKKGSKLDFFIK